MDKIPTLTELRTRHPSLSDASLIRIREVYISNHARKAALEQQMPKRCQCGLH